MRSPGITLRIDQVENEKIRARVAAKIRQGRPRTLVVWDPAEAELLRELLRGQEVTG